MDGGNSADHGAKNSTTACFPEKTVSSKLALLRSTTAEPE
jgi:hypothetical protein